MVNKFNNILFILTLAVCSCTNQETRVITGMEGKTMPYFKMLLIDSSIIDSHHLGTQKPIIFLFFNPQCPYCKAQTRDIIDNIESFKKINFYLISNASIEDIKIYSNSFQLYKYTNIMVAHDVDQVFNLLFKAPGVPFFAFYNTNKKLTKALIGGINPNIILHNTINDN